MGAFSTLSTYCLALLCITPLLSPWPEFHVCLLVTRVNLLNDVLFLSACRYFEKACPRKRGASVRAPTGKEQRRSCFFDSFFKSHADSHRISPSLEENSLTFLMPNFQSLIWWLCSSYTSCCLMFRSLASTLRPLAITMYPL